MSEMKVMTADQLKAKVEANEEVYIIDVREDFEVANGMIPNAVHIPMNEIPNNLEILDQHREYVIVCAGGVRSEKVCHYLLANGYDVVNMEGGMHSWTGDVQ
ncbi:rhodanese-like domain-containing protein [Bacillus massiliigorillae]|uniref:rhodanese-like domain-containing protein n=1 Tax=Bacillus massiliigorillae TaxID=1243664 RepID=UPI0003A634E7|nr:rhodanese-like domain-containing protein [Bacillus massiliigorillae]